MPLLWVASGPVSPAAQRAPCTEFPNPCPASAWPAGLLGAPSPHQPHARSPGLHLVLLPDFAQRLKIAKGQTHGRSWTEGRPRKNRVGSASTVPGGGEGRTGSSGTPEATRRLNTVAPLPKEDTVRNLCVRGYLKVTPGNSSVDPKYVAKCADLWSWGACRGLCGSVPRIHLQQEKPVPPEGPQRNAFGKAYPQEVILGLTCA